MRLTGFSDVGSAALADFSSRRNHERMLRWRWTTVRWTTGVTTERRERAMADRWRNMAVIGGTEEGGLFVVVEVNDEVTGIYELFMS